MACTFIPGARRLGTVVPFGAMSGSGAGGGADAFGTPLRGDARDPGQEGTGLVQVLIVDSDPDCRRRFAQAVQSDPGLALLDAVATGEAALRSLARRRPDVMIVEPGLPDLSGITLIRQCAARLAQTEILVRTQVGDDERVLSSIESGAAGYLYKDASAEWIVACIHALRAGGALISPGVARRVLARFHLRVVVTGTGHSGFGALAQEEAGPLSTDDIGVLRLVACGTALHEIADILAMPPRAVLEQIKGIYRQLAARSRAVQGLP